MTKNNIANNAQIVVEGIKANTNGASICSAMPAKPGDFVLKDPVVVPIPIMPAALVVAFKLGGIIGAVNRW